MKLILNLAFSDMMHAPLEDRIPFAYCPDDFYPEEDLRAFISRAVDCGFTEIYHRVDALNTAMFRSRVKPRGFRGKWPGTLQRYDPLEVAVDAGHRAGARVFAWATPFDNTWERRDYLRDLKPGGELHAGFSWEHPEYELRSRDGEQRIVGVFSFGHPEVQEYFLNYYDELLAYPIDGIFLSDRSHSNQQHEHLEYGFNQPVVESYIERFGGDPREGAHYDLERFSRVQGAFYTDFLRRVSERVHATDRELAVKCSWTRENRISGRLGGLHRSFFEWQKWIDEALIDALVVGGDLATGRDPEFRLPPNETAAESVDPEFFRKQTKRSVPLYRWLTMQAWGWKNEADLAPPQPWPRAFRNEVVAEALDAVAESGMDGALMHESVVVTGQEQWDLYQRFRDRLR